MCRATIPRPRADAIDRIADLLASWVASLGAGVPQKCETLACIRGVHPTTAERKDVIVLLLMKREQPRLQFFARCALPSDSEEGDDAQTLPEALPCVVSLRIVESRLSTPFRAVDIRSSEELAEELAASGMSWSIRPLVWRLPERRQLLDHIVTGLGEAFELKTKKGSQGGSPRKRRGRRPARRRSACIWQGCCCCCCACQQCWCFATHPRWRSWRCHGAAH